MRTRSIKASLLVRDLTIYPRAQVDPYHVNELVEAYKSGSPIPPPLVERTTHRIVDGYHRIAAWQKLEGVDATIDVLEKVYATEADLIEEAILLNAAHGRALSVYDKARSIAIAKEAGISRERIATALHITRERVDELLLTRFSGDGEVLKRTTVHFAGRQMTPAQVEYNRGPAGGMDQLFYINQVVSLIEADAVDWSRDRVVAAMKRLHGQLEAKLVSIP